MNNKLKQGFSLIELLVAMAIMSVIFIATMQILSSAVRIESRVLAGEAMLEQANYLLDFMSKDIRMASRFAPHPHGDVCGIGSKFVDSDGIEFVSQRADCVKYYRDVVNKQIFLQRKEKNPAYTEGGSEPLYLDSVNLPLTSTDFEVTMFDYEILGNVEDDEARSKVRIYIEMRSKKFKHIKLKLQTVVSTRNRD